jgi:hypothetical protein
VLGAVGRSCIFSHSADLLFYKLVTNAATVHHDNAGRGWEKERRSTGLRSGATPSDTRILIEMRVPARAIAAREPNRTCIADKSLAE